MLNKNSLDELKTIHKDVVDMDEYGWVCSNCGIVQWFETKTIRNAAFEDHILESPKCKKVVAKSHKQDLPPRNGYRK